MLLPWVLKPQLLPAIPAALPKLTWSELPWEMQAAAMLKVFSLLSPRALIQTKQLNPSLYCYFFPPLLFSSSFFSLCFLSPLPSMHELIDV